MITVVCFQWPPRYCVAHVNILRAALEVWLPVRHELVCVTSDSRGIDTRVRIVTPDESLPDERRYRKLMLFRPDAASVFGGERLLGIDLDVTPVGDLAPLVQRDEDFVIWRDPQAALPQYAETHRYNSSLILMTAGCRPQVYTEFELAAAKAKMESNRLVGSDQAWIGALLGPDEAVWTQEDGVLGFRQDLNWSPETGDDAREWPSDARLIVSHGEPKPWDLAEDHPLRQVYECHTRLALRDLRMRV